MTDAAASRELARRIAAHVMSRARHAECGRIDLVPTPGGFGTPAFGPDHRVIRLSGDVLVVESTAAAATTQLVPVNGATLAELAAAAGADLTTAFDAGHDTPAIGVADEPLVLGAATVHAIGAWLGFGVQVIDGVLATLPRSAAPGRARLWPEHFDLGIDVAVADGSRVNIGASPGDAFHDLPYLYVGPWSGDRPGDPEYWNAPFGAVLAARDDLTVTDGVQWVMEGVRRFG